MPETSWSSYADFYRRSPYGVFPQEHRRSPGQLPCQMILVEQGPHAFSDPELSETVLALPLAVPGRCRWAWRIGAHRQAQQAEPGRMLVVPADVESHWEVDGSRRILILSVPNATLRRLFGRDCPADIGQAFRSLSEATWADPLVEALMRQLWQGLDGESPGQARAYLADGLLTALLSQLLIRAGTRLEAQKEIALPPWRLRRVRHFAEARLGESLSLDDLAAAAGLSRRHFARSFHQETGQTPHRWLMQRRLEAAQALLRDTAEPIGAIAERCGFSSQSHLTAALRAATGLTPLRWRHRLG